MGITGGSSSGGSRSSSSGSSSSRKGITAGSSSSSRSAPAAEVKPPKQSNLMKVLMALDKGRRGVTAVVKELDDLVPGLKGDREKSDGFSLGDIKKNYDKNLGAGDLIAGTGNKWVDRGIGLAGDLALDPLSYATLGMGSGAKKAATGAARLGKGRVTAKEVARKAIEQGDDELAERVMSRGTRGSVNAMTAAEAAAYGVRQGPTFGLKGAKVAVPGGDKLARTVSDALAKSTVSTRLANASFGTGLATGMKGATPVQRMIARDSNRALRMESKATRMTALTALNTTVREAGAGYDAKAVRDSMEGVGVPNETGHRLTQTLDEVHAWASSKLGRDLPRREDYLSHRLTDEAKAMKAGEATPRKGKSPTVLKQRGHQKGDIFYGQELQDGSLSEMNAIFQKATGRKHNYFDDDPVKIAKQYVEDLTTMVARSEEAFATEAIKRSGKGGLPNQKEIIPAATKEARREVKELDKVAAKVTDELDRLRNAKDAAGRRVEELDEFAARNVDEATTKAKAAVPEAGVPGLLGTLPDLQSRMAAIAAAAGRDTTVASDELIALTGAKRLDGEQLLGEQAFLMPSGTIVPERNIASHASAQLQLADLVARRAAASADVAARLRPEVSAQAAQGLDPTFVVRDAEAMAEAAADNAKKLDIVSGLDGFHAKNAAATGSKDAQRVAAFKKAEVERAGREEVARLYDEAAKARAAGDDELANIAGLEAEALRLNVELVNLDAKFQKAMAQAGQVRFVDDLQAMMAQNLAQLADGRFAEPWVADAAKQMADAMTPANVGKLVKEFDRMSQWWRASALLSPGYHGRNFTGGLFNNMLHGMDWNRYPEYRKAHKQYKRGGVEAISDPKVREAWRAAETRTNFLVGEDISDVQRMIAESTGGEGGSRIGRNNPLFRANFKAGAHVEAALRMPLFTDAFIKSGGDIDASIDTVMRYHFDYDDLSKMEREVGRRAFGFYTWARNNLPLMMSEMADQPGKFTRYTHLKRNMEMGQEDDPQKPGYFNKLMAISVPGAKWKGNQIYWTPDLPFISAAGTVGEGTAGLLSSLNPLIKTPLETITNRKFFEDRNFSDTLRPGPTDPAFGTVLKILSRLPKGLPMVPRVERGADGSVLMDEREMNKIESLMPLLSRLRRLYPTEDKYQERALTSWLSFAFGIGARTLDESMRGGEMSRREDQAKKAQRRQAKIEGGKTLADFEAAERQARAIKNAQEGRRG